MAVAAPMETFRGTVYPWQMDMFGHMNVQFYTARFDEATWHFVAAFGFTPAYFRERDRALVAVESRTLYKRELFAGDIIHVRTEMLEVQRKSVRFIHRMYRVDEEAASTEITALHLDATARKTVPFPDDIAAQLGILTA
jgi:acyl-CoA thioester hydrolase